MNSTVHSIVSLLPSSVPRDRLLKMFSPSQHLSKSLNRCKKVRPDPSRHSRDYGSSLPRASASAKGAARFPDVMSLSYIAPTAEAKPHDRHEMDAAESLVTLQNRAPQERLCLSSQNLSMSSQILRRKFCDEARIKLERETETPYSSNWHADALSSGHDAHSDPFTRDLLKSSPNQSNDIASDHSAKASSETSSSGLFGDEWKQPENQSPDRCRRDPRPEYTPEQKLFIGHRRIIRGLAWQEVQVEFPLWFPENPRSDSGLNSIYYRFRQDGEDKGGLGIGKCKGSDMKRDYDVLKVRCNQANYRWLRARRIRNRNGAIVTIKDDM